MIFEMHTPAPPLGDDVTSLMYFRHYQPEHSIERVVPDGSVFLILELDGMTRHLYDNLTLESKCEFNGAWISGMQRGFLSISAHDDSEMFVVQFKAGGAYPYLKRPLHELTDRVTPAVETLGPGVVSLRDKLIGGATPADMFSTASDYLLGIHEEPNRRSNGLIRSLVEVISTNATAKIGDLVRDSDYSQKQIIHLFKKEVGLTPKAFQRIRRFNELLPRIKNEEALSWAQLSADCGYYDQAHFIKEFREFSGFSPKEFLIERKDDDRINFFPLN